MTTYHYSLTKSTIVDYLMAPICGLLGKSELELDFPRTAIELLGSAYDDLFKCGAELADMKDSIKEHYLIYRGHSVAYYCYRLVLSRGIEPSTIEEAIEAIAQLSPEDYLLAFELALGYRGDIQKTVTLADYLEENILEADERWYWFQAYHKPEKALANMVAILREVTVRYRPYHDKYAKEIAAYAANLNLYETMSAIQMVEVSNMLDKHEGGIDVYILSPMHIRFSFLSNEDNVLPFDSLFFSMKVDDVMNAANQLDLSNLTTILKQFGDETRYQVLLSIIGGNLKNKEIAEQLDITAAAVSFHTQKLLNSQVLVVNSDSDGIKYQINKKMLLEVIDRLTTDFHLDEP
ncbi:ArsR/SmtB family transcription factor [Streptococcus fryi]